MVDLECLSFHNVINGQFRAGADTHQGTDPRTEELLWPVPIATEEDLDDAVAAAQIAFKKWSKTTVGERQKRLVSLSTELLRQKDLLSGIIAKETGKSKLLSDLEIEHSINFLDFNASQTLPDEVAYEDDEVKIVTTHTPLGVIGAICPWNFPLVLAMGKIAASLVTGNCVIVKPSPFTPYSILKFAELATGIVPPGVIQALNGDNNLGAHMTAHPKIQKISFTGSTQTGKKIMESASKTLKRITLELGGNDATIVLPDVDVNLVAAQVATGCLFNSGQMCVATKRVYVHENIYASFKHRLVEEAKKLLPHLNPNLPSIMGPIQNRMQYAIVQNLIEDSKANGYKLALSGKQSTGPGLFIEPVVIETPPDSSDVVKKEQFGPIIPLLSWKSEDEVIKRANDTVVGLGACVWARDTSDAERVGRQLEAGTLWLNSYEKPLAVGYFSGQKESGFGGEWGKRGLLSYCNTQSIHIYKSPQN